MHLSLCAAHAIVHDMSSVHDSKLIEVFGDPQSTIEDVDARAQAAFPALAPIVWEGDPQTFQFSYVGAPAAKLLGYPVLRWITEATFWADVVVSAADRDDAIAYCALATGLGADHEFEYRARTADGRTLWLRDFVRVILGPKRVPVRLRGIMFDITAEKLASASANRPAPPRPSIEELRAG